jgi:hypothetical protein
MNRQAALTVLTYREQLMQCSRVSFDFTLLRFMLRALVRALRGERFDRRLVALLAKRL